MPKSIVDKKEKPNRQPAKEQSARFKETARQLGCDETPGALDRAFGKIEPKRPAEGRAKS